MRLLGRWQLFAYGSLGLPLAMAALPVYVHVPKLYGGVLGLELALVGAVLLGVGDAALGDQARGRLEGRGILPQRPEGWAGAQEAQEDEGGQGADHGVSFGSGAGAGLVLRRTRATSTADWPNCSPAIR